MKKDIKKYIPWIVLLVIILCLSLLYIFSKRITDEQLRLYSEKIEEAQTYVEAKQYSMGIKKYYEAVDIIPSKLEAYEGVVDILLIKGRMQDAKEVIEESARPLSAYDKSLLYKKAGDGYYQIENYREAFDMYDEGLVLGVKNMGLELMLGKALLKLGDMDGAKKQFQKTGYEGDDQLESNLLLSYIYAVDDVSKAKKTLESLNATEKMQIYYEEFDEILDSLDEDEKYNASKLSRVYINNGYPYLAMALLEPMKEEIAEYLEGMYFLGRAYVDYGEYDKALEALDGALTLGGMESDITWAKARAYLMKNDLDNTFKNYDSAVGYMGDEFTQDFVTEYVNVLLDNKQTFKADELIKNLLTLKEDAYLNLLAVEVNYELKENVKVNFYLSELEGLDLTDTEEKEYLQWKIKILSEEEEDIDEYLNRLLTKDKFNPHYYYYLGKLQIKDKDTDLAIQSLEKALEYDLKYEITEEASKLLSSLR